MLLQSVTHSLVAYCPVAEKTSYNTFQFQLKPTVPIFIYSLSNDILSLLFVYSRKSHFINYSMKPLIRFRHPVLFLQPHAIG